MLERLSQASDVELTGIETRILTVRCLLTEAVEEAGEKDRFPETVCLRPDRPSFLNFLEKPGMGGTQLA